MISIVIILKNDLGIVDTLRGLNRINFSDNYEVIVVDRSTIVYPTIDVNYPLKWIQFDPKGKRYTIPEQRNIGITAASGNVIVFIDASCIPDKNWLTNILEPIFKDGESVVMGKTGSTGKLTLNDRYHEQLAKLKYVDEAPTINLAIKKNIFETVGYFDENLEYGSDVDWTWRAVNSGYKIRYYPSAFVTHDWGDTKQEIKRSILYGKARTRIILKHLKNKWTRLFGQDSPVILYPFLILLSPLILLQPWLLTIIPLLVLKNVKERNPIEVVAKHFVYGYGVLIEIKNQLFNRVFGAPKEVTHPITEIVALSILAFYGYGLVINSILPKLGINDPLSMKWLWPTYILIFPLVIKLTSELVILFREPFTSWLRKLLILVLPFVAITGVLLLDNRNNPVGSILLVILSIIIFITTLFTKVDERLIKITIFSVSLSLILANSMRSSYLVGWDIHQEYGVYKLAIENSRWNISLLRDAYNACLSITLLPAILSKSFSIDSMFLFKFVMPIILAITPLSVYSISKKLVNSKLAFAAAFGFLIQTQYFSQMPALIRQGVAFLFFSLAVDNLIRSDVPKKYKDLNILVYGIGMILSHYSTNYLWIGIFALGLFIEFIARLFKFKNENKLPLFIFSVLLSLSFCWNVLITNTAGGLIDTVYKVATNINSIASLENKSEAVRGAIYANSDPSQAIEDYYRETLNGSKNSIELSKYPISYKSLSVNNNISLKNPVVSYFHLITPWIYRILIVIGLVLIVFNTVTKRIVAPQLLLGTAMLAEVSLIMILPFASVSYNFERLFQQSLVLLACFSVYLFQLSYKLKRLSLVFLSILLSSLLVKNTGLVDQSVFNKSFWMFDSSGEQYFRYYTVKSEIDSLAWLDKSISNPILMYTDRYTKLRSKAYTNLKFIYLSSQLNPVVIEKYGYVLAGNAANNAGVVFADTENLAMTINFQRDFFESKYNRVYSNNSSTIYK